MKKVLIVGVVLTLCFVGTGSNTTAVYNIGDTLEFYAGPNLSYEECKICYAVCDIWYESDFILTANTVASSIPISEWGYRVSTGNGTQFDFSLDFPLCEHCAEKYSGKLKQRLRKLFDESIGEFQKAEQLRSVKHVRLRMDNHINGLSEKIKEEQEKLAELKSQLNTLKGETK